MMVRLILVRIIPQINDSSLNGFNYIVDSMKMKRNVFVLPVIGLLFILCQGCLEDKEENPAPESPSITVESGEDIPVFETAGSTASLTFTATSIGRFL